MFIIKLFSFSTFAKNVCLVTNWLPWIRRSYQSGFSSKVATEKSSVENLKGIFLRHLDTCFFAVCTSLDEKIVIIFYIFSLPEHPTNASSMNYEKTKLVVKLG